MNRYIQVLCPTVEITETDPRTGIKRKLKAPILIRYQRILDIEKGATEKQWKKYKAELFGSDTEVFAPELYNELEIVTRLRIDLLSWNTEYPLDLKAQIIAKAQLQTVVDIIRRHDELQRDKEKKRLADAERKAQEALQAAKKPPKRGKRKR